MALICLIMAVFLRINSTLVSYFLNLNYCPVWYLFKPLCVPFQHLKFKFEYASLLDIIEKMNVVSFCGIEQPHVDVFLSCDVTARPYFMRFMCG